MFTYPLTVQFHAKAPPAAVWAALENVTRWREVIPDLASIRLEPAGQLEAGAVIHTRTGPVGASVEMEYRVLEAEPPRHLLLETETYDWLGRTDYTIEPDEDGAKVTVVSTMEVTGNLLRLQMLVVGRTLNKQRETALRSRTRALLTLAESLAESLSAPLTPPA
jgi:carbon monoxide dehydrogenase subunit G